MNKFPSEISAWKNDVARRLVALRGAVDDIWKGLPQIPDPEIGMPFTGPLVPDPFVFPPTDRSGGTPNSMGTPNTGGTSVCGGCPSSSASYRLTVSGATDNTCVECSALNTTFTLSITGTQCQWDSARFDMCSASLAPGTDGPFWRMSFSGGTTTLELRGNTIFGNPTVIATYSYGGCPPALVSGSGSSITLDYVSGSQCNFPATVEVEAI